MAGSQLSVSDSSLTIDLCGQSVSITGVPAGAAAVNVPLGSSLTIEDTSSTNLAEQGTLTVVGGSESSTAAGAGAGSGGSAGQASTGSLTIAAGQALPTLPGAGAWVGASTIVSAGTALTSLSRG